MSKAFFIIILILFLPMIFMFITNLNIKKIQLKLTHDEIIKRLEDLKDIYNDKNYQDAYVMLCQLIEDLKEAQKKEKFIQKQGEEHV